MRCVRDCRAWRTGAWPGPGRASTAATWPPTRSPWRCSDGRRSGGALRGVGAAPSGTPGGRRARPGGRLDQRVPRVAVVRDQPLRRRHRRSAGGRCRQSGDRDPLRSRPGRRGQAGRAPGSRLRRSRPWATPSSASRAFPARSLGWKQFRALGAAALDLCAVACWRPRRLRRLQPRRPRTMGLPGRATGLHRGGRVRGRRPWAQTWWSWPMTSGARRSPPLLLSSSTSWSSSDECSASRARKNGLTGPERPAAMGEPSFPGRVPVQVMRSAHAEPTPYHQAHGRWWLRRAPMHADDLQALGYWISRRHVRGPRLGQCSVRVAEGSDRRANWVSHPGNS